MITFTVTAETADEFRNQFLGFSALVSGGNISAGNAAPIEKPATRNRKPADTATPIVGASSEDPVDLDTDEPVITIEQIRAKATEVSQAGKQPQVKALLAQFEAKSVSTIPEDKFSAFYKALEAL